ncbi:MAG: hypothetical protein ABEJ82_00295 [Haloplanus sp.]
MSVVSLLGRGVASGLAGALVWVGASVLVTPGPDVVGAAVGGTVLAVLVVGYTLATRVQSA